VPPVNNRYNALTDNEDDDNDSEVGTVYTAVAFSGTHISNQDKADLSLSLHGKQRRKAPFQSLDVALATTSWGVDTMASTHCSGNKDLFIELHKCTPAMVKTLDGSIVTANYSGSVEIPLYCVLKQQFVRVRIDNVLYNERFTANLLGAISLGELGWTLLVSRKEATLTTPDGSQVRLSTRGRVAMIEGNYEEHACIGRRVVKNTMTTVDEVVRLHERLGHPNWSKLKHMTEKGQTRGIARLSLSTSSLAEAERKIRSCAACKQGKSKRIAFGHSGLDHGQEAFEVLHADTFIVTHPGSVPSDLGLVVVDPYTGLKVVAQVANKSEIAKIIIEIIERIQRQSGKTVKRLYFDGGSEYLNDTVKTYCRKQGLEWRVSPPRTPELNGIAERSVAVVKDGMRTMNLHGQVPTRFWFYAMSHFVRMWNCSHISKRTGITPYEAVYGKQPSIEYVGVYGCDAWLHLPRSQRRTTEPKAVPCVYLGHETAKNCPIVYRLDTKIILAARDVRFRESSFELARTVLHEMNGDSSHPLSAESTDGGQSDDDDLMSEYADSRQYEVESITDRREVKGRLRSSRPRIEYRVKWAGYSDAESTWEPAEELLRNARNKVSEYERRCVEEASTSTSANVTASTNSAAAAAADTARDEFEERHEQRADNIAHMLMCAMSRDPRAQQQPEAEKALRQVMLSSITAGVGLLDSKTPRTHRQAMAGPDATKWKNGEEKEWTSCNEQDTWTLVPRA
jgi:hypothetical protein